MINFNIILFYTASCYGCNIVENNISQVLDSLNRPDIIFTKINLQNKEFKKFLKTYNIEDVPTVVLLKNNDCVAKIVGTFKSEELKKLIIEKFVI